MHILIYLFFFSGGFSLACSGLIPVGRLVPDEQKGVPGLARPKGRGEVDEANINIHLLPTNSNPQDTFGAHCVDRRDREGTIYNCLYMYMCPVSLFIVSLLDVGLNPVLSLIPMYFKGHPTFQLLSETLRNQVTICM